MLVRAGVDVPGHSAEVAEPPPPETERLRLRRLALALPEVRACGRGGGGGGAGARLGGTTKGGICSKAASNFMIYDMI